MKYDMIDTSQDTWYNMVLSIANYRSSLETEPRMNTVFDAIAKEREFQDSKWGKTPHTLGEWILLVEDELAEAKRALIKGGKGRDSVRSELVQVAALVVAALEQHGLDEPHDKRQI